MLAEDEPIRASLLSLPNFYDYLKHMTTLSTGTVVLLATFAEKFPQDAVWRPLLSLSIGALLLAVLASLISMLFVLSCQRHKPDPPGWEENTAIAFFLISGVALFGGLSSVGAFAMRNF